MIRVGIGYDSHRFAPDRPLRLGGVLIPHGHGLVGHSDADAISHALTDAMLGAAALGDIGHHFPDTDPAFAGADSIALLVEAHRRVGLAGWTLRQADITVVLEAPKLAPHVAAIRATLAQATGIAVADLSVKAKTNEGMGWIGRGEGIAVIAVATLRALRIDEAPAGPHARATHLA
ncbi:MAG TPA: 2-C-methyl-D-erythritol 2,4-cyclodiphosphate synthase [Gemmatimonadales bacterium]|nr:2-C-methyl-D-erythritol 2,4-cyclodiphosphate synthase [Gemmatimonadales bacterium]